MKINKIAISAFIIGLGAMTSCVALAKDEVKTNIGIGGNLQVESETRTGVNIDDNKNEGETTLSTQGSGKVDIEATDDHTDGDKNDDATPTSASLENNTQEDKNDSSMEDSHRSTVATFVQNLLKVADHEGGIGTEVRAVAQAQNDSNTTESEAIAKVEGRGGFKTFFIGADYKNIGVLRSQMVTTANNIAKLKLLAEQATSAEDKATLQAQIQVLETEQVKINAFITAKENKFSLFGWMFK